MTTWNCGSCKVAINFSGDCWDCHGRRAGWSGEEITRVRKGSPDFVVDPNEPVAGMTYRGESTGRTFAIDSIVNGTATLRGDNGATWPCEANVIRDGIKCGRLTVLSRPDASNVIVLPAGTVFSLAAVREYATKHPIAAGDVVYGTVDLSRAPDDTDRSVDYWRTLAETHLASLEKAGKLLNAERQRASMLADKCGTLEYAYQSSCATRDGLDTRIADLESQLRDAKAREAGIRRGAR